MTEEQARTKWCPMVKVGIDNNFNCIASDCMMWRWEKIRSLEYCAFSTDGYCGLGG